MKSTSEDIEIPFFGNLDYDYGFRAMRAMLFRMDHADQALADEIAKAEEFAKQTHGNQNDFAVDNLIELYHYSGYQDAAHSMAAVGMIAPFVESLFKETFKDFEKEWLRIDLVNNIIKSIEEIGMKKYMPNDLKVTLSAIFEYRNKMLHNSFEWPLEERKRFARRLNNSGWPSDWFSSATSGDEPWMFYMTQTFIEYCIDTIEQIAVGIEKFQIDSIRQSS